MPEGSGQHGDAGCGQERCRPREALAAGYKAGQGGDRVIVTAGRSGRDYRTLAEAARGLPCRLHIICDLDGPLRQIAPFAQVAILRAGHGADYIRELVAAVDAPSDSPGGVRDARLR